MRETVVFDFDKTIISKDSYVELLVWLIRQSRLKTLVTYVILPFVIGLFYIKSTRLFAINLMSLIALSFQKRNIFGLRRDFLNHFFSNGNCFVFGEAMKTIANHINQGRKVLIISGCPQWLLMGVLRHIGVRKCQVVGSKQVVRHGSLKMVDHCYSQNKVNMARLRNVDTKDWHSGYSDSLADLPFLKLCENRFIVNSSPEKERVFKKELDNNCHFVRWTRRV